MPFCTACGHENDGLARFCNACGQVIPDTSAPSSEPVAIAKGTNGLRTATMVIGLIAAVLLLVGGCAGFAAGATFGAFEEAFDTEIDDPDSNTSTTQDVENAGGWAMVVSIFLFLGAGLARVATRTSLVLWIVAMPMLIGLAVTDWSSIFALPYYFAILMAAVCIVLMSIAFLRRRRA